MVWFVITVLCNIAGCTITVHMDSILYLIDCYRKNQQVNVAWSIYSFRPKIILCVFQATSRCWIYTILDYIKFLFFIFTFLARLHEVHRAIAVTPVVHVPVPVRVRVRVPVRVTLALKFSRSPYLDNHSSESIHTWTIDTL